MKWKLILLFVMVVGGVVFTANLLTGAEEPPPVVWNNKAGIVNYNVTGDWRYLNTLGKNNGSTGFNINTGEIGFAKEQEFIGEIIPVAVAQSPVDSNYYLCPIINPNVVSQSQSGDDISRVLQYSGNKEITCYEYDNYGNSLETNLDINNMEIACNNKGECKLNSNVTFTDFTPLDSGFGYIFVPKNPSQFRYVTYENNTIDLLNIGKISNVSYELVLNYIDNTTLSYWEWEDMLYPMTYVNESNIQTHFEVLEIAGKRGLLTGTYGYGNISNIVVDPTQNWDSGTLCDFDDPSCWASGDVPVAGDDVVFNGTGTGDVDINNNTLPQGLASWTVTPEFTGTINFNPMFAIGTWGANAVGTQEWNVTNNINISGGTSKVSGDYLLPTLGLYNLTEDGHGQIWRSLNGNITVGSGGVIDGVGTGFPPGVGPGYLASGIGVSHGARGGTNSISADPYGNATAPTSLGSGGDDGGTLGGGAIKLEASDRLVMNGLINVSDNLPAPVNEAGSPGSIWLKADNITGTGQLEAAGHFGPAGAGSSGGRIRIEYGSSMEYTGVIELRGGISGLIKEETGTLTFTNNTWLGNMTLKGNIGLLGGDYGEGNVTNIRGHLNTNGFNISVFGDCFYNELNPIICYNKTKEGEGVWINASGNITISSTSFIDGTGLGFPVAFGPGYGGNVVGSNHGGRGGANVNGITYGNEKEPMSIGSGGDDINSLGGSAIRLQSADRIIMDGIINVSDFMPSSDNEPGSAGSIWFKADNISGSGVLSASSSVGFRGSGGGRIAFTSLNVINFGGIVKADGGLTTFDANEGAGGTVFLNATNSIVTIMNISAVSGDQTLPLGGNITFMDSLLILGGLYNATLGGNITTNYSDCASSFPGVFVPSRIDQNDSVDCEPGVDTCTCPGADENWEIDHSDFCVITDGCELTSGNLSFINSGVTNFSNNVNCSNLTTLASGTLNIKAGGKLDIG